MINDTISINIDLFECNADERYDNEGKLLSYVQADTPEYMLSVRAVLNGEKQERAFDLWCFMQSRKTREWEIFTCSCGIAGCAGIYDGIKVKVRKHTVEWRLDLKHNSGYNGLKRFYSFDRKAYEQAIEDVMAKLVEYAKDPNIFDQFTHFHGDHDKLSYRMKSYNEAYKGILPKWWY